MIIRRYLSSQVLTTTLAVALILTVILMSGRVIKYFGMAAQGRLDVELLTAVLVYRLPGFLELIIPVGFFLGILLSLGRLYVDSEMAILSATGIGPSRLLKVLMWPASLVACLVAAISLYITPTGNYESERLFAVQDTRTTFEMLRPGFFQRLEGPGHVIYTQGLSDDKKQLKGVFIYEARKRQGERKALISAESGYRYTDQGSGVQYLVLVNGARHEVQAGSASYRALRFDSYAIRLAEPERPKEVTEVKTQATTDLMSRGDSLSRGELGWRLSLPLLVPVVALLALPLSRVNPRQGRFLKLLPAILLYLSYVVLLVAVKGAVEKGKLDVWGFVAVHAVYLATGFVLMNWERLQWRWRNWRLQGNGS